MGAYVKLSDASQQVHVVVTDKPVDMMSDRELLEELVTTVRDLRTGIKSAGESINSNPMLGKLFGGLGSVLGGL